MGNQNSALNAKLKAKEWQWQIKTEIKHLDKEIKKIDADEVKLRKEIQTQAEKGNVSSVQMLAKSVVRSRQAVQRLEKTKASMHGVVLNLTTAIATMSTTSSLKVSADCMRKMNQIADLPQVGATMESMRREMARCAEVDDAMEELFKAEDEDTQADFEVQKVLESMALDKMGPLAQVAAPTAAPAAVPMAGAAPPQRILVAVGDAPSPPEQLPKAEALAPAAAPPTTVGTAADEGAASVDPVALDTDPTVAPATAPILTPTVAPTVVPTVVPTVAPAATVVAPGPAAESDNDDTDLMRRLQMLRGP